MTSRRVVVLLSGTGRSLANLIAKRNSGHFDVDFQKVIASRPGVRGLVVADRARIPIATVSRKDFVDGAAFAAALNEEILPLEPDLVVMAGFLSHYAAPTELDGKIINIHPSLLPQFGGKGMYGHKVHEAVLASKARISGCTVHYVNANYDEGAPILQLSCPVVPDDDPDRLAARVFARECDALPRVIDWCLSGRVRLEEGRVHFGPGFDQHDFR